MYHRKSTSESQNVHRESTSRSQNVSPEVDLSSHNPMTESHGNIFMVSQLRLHP